MKETREECMPVMKDPVERALLCTLFLDRSSAIDALPVLRPEMFADPYHGLVYRAFMAIYDWGGATGSGFDGVGDAEN